MNFENHLKRNQWLKIYFSIQFTDIILGIVVFLKKKYFYLVFLSFWNITIRPLGLWKYCYGSLEVCYGSTRSLSWLCEESIMALQGVLHGSARNSSGWDNASRSKSQVPHKTDSSRAMKDFSQIHDGLLLEPWRTPHKAMMAFSQTLRSYFHKIKN